MSPNIFLLVNFKSDLPWYVEEIQKHFDAYVCTAGFIPNKARQEGDIFINWGVGRPTKWPITGPCINLWDSVRRSVNKDHTLALFKENYVPCIEYTYDWKEANAWKDEGFSVYVRSMIDSYDGHDLTVVDPDDDNVVPVAPLYTKGFNNNLEFRVHVMGGKVIDYLQKKRKIDKEINEKVRTTAGGWIHARHNIHHFDDVKSIAVKACEAVGLAFAGVDIGVDYDYRNNKIRDVRVFETNTAPELEPTTLNNYIKGFETIIDTLKKQKKEDIIKSHETKKELFKWYYAAPPSDSEEVALSKYMNSLKIADDVENDDEEDLI